ncbi:glycosyltransferase [Streptomonospora sediminis]
MVSASGPNGRHYAFFSFPGYGHIKPALPVVGELVRRGHRVTHFVAERFTAAAENPGVRVVGYASDFPEPFGEAQSVDEAAAMLVDLLNEGFAPLGPALESLSGDPPDLIVHDDIGAHTARLLSWRWDLPLVRLFAHFAGPGSTAGEDTAGAGGQAGQGGRAEQSGQAEPGRADGAEILSRPFLGRAWLDRMDELAALGFATEDVMAAVQREDACANIVFVPRAFQPNGDTGFGDRYVFVGPSPELPGKGAAWTPPAGKRIALVSLGTTHNDTPGFFRNCAEAFSGGDWHVVMTVGDRADAAAIGGAGAGAGIEMHRWLPHSAVLPYAGVYVGTGGMNSVMEALYWRVPVVAIPRTGEQRANAERVAELGLGTHLERCDASPQAVRRAASAAAGDPAVAERVRAMSARIADAGGARRAADEIERCTPARPAAEDRADGRPDPR